MKLLLRARFFANKLLLLLLLTGSGAAVAQDASTPERPTPGPRKSYKINLTVGVDLVSYPGTLNKEWVSDSTGLGMRQNLGFSLRFDYRLIHRLAVSFTAGYAGWELVRRYTLNGVNQYQETQRLIRIPLQLGLKIYPFKGVYVMPEGGINLMRSRVETSDGHPTPTSTSVITTPISYGGSVGYEFHAWGLLVDLSGRYQLLRVDNLNLSTQSTPLSGQVQSGGIRLGIGFSK